MSEGSLLAVLADGVGGNIRGGTAAEMAVDKFISLHRAGVLNPGTLGEYFAELAVEMRDVNREMATTIVLALIVRRGKKMEMTYTWAGDSRLYLLTAGNRRFRRGAKVSREKGRNLYILSEDDTIPWRYFMHGEMGLDRVTTSESKNRLFFSLPRDGERMNDRIVTVGVSPGDRLLLCCDGFWERFEKQASMAKWLEIKPGGFGRKFDRFMEQGLSLGKKIDNTTCIKIDLEEELFGGKSQ